MDEFSLPSQFENRPVLPLPAAPVTRAEFNALRSEFEHFRASFARAGGATPEWITRILAAHAHKDGQTGADER